MNSFDFAKVEDFDDHIARSIPTLAQLDTILNRVMFDFAQAGTAVVDVGCSTGRLLRGLHKREDVGYIGIDRDMQPEPHPQVAFLKADFFDLELPEASVISAIFVAQFLPFRRREAFFRRCYDALARGGVLLVAEKTHNNNHRLENSTQAQLTTFKRETFTDGQIVDKAVSLAPVMHQQTEAGLMAELSSFSTVDPIWRWGSFGCYAAVK